MCITITFEFDTVLGNLFGSQSKITIGAYKFFKFYVNGKLRINVFYFPTLRSKNVT